MKRKKIIFVCTGNTCRSPMAEALLRSEIKKRKIKWWDVTSRGLRAEVGSGMSENSKTALAEIGVSLPDFKSRQLTDKLAESATLIVTMTAEQLNFLKKKDNAVCIKDVCGYDVPDPYGCGLEVYRWTRDDLKRACNVIIEKFILKYEE